MCIHVWVYACQYRSPRRPEALALLVLVLQVAVSCLKWMWGTENWTPILWGSIACAQLWIYLCTTALHKETLKMKSGEVTRWLRLVQVTQNLLSIVALRLSLVCRHSLYLHIKQLHPQAGDCLGLSKISFQDCFDPRVLHVLLVFIRANSKIVELTYSTWNMATSRDGLMVLSYDMSGIVNSFPLWFLSQKC